MKVLVYGTLKKGHGNNMLLQGSEFLRAGEFKVHGCQLRANDESPFPYLFKKFNQKTIPFYGELWEVDTDTLDDLDRLEGHPNFYTRIFSKENDCFVYIYSGDGICELDVIYTFL